MLYQLLCNIETNIITFAHRYNLSVHDFQTVSLITQNFLIVQIMALLEIDKQLVNAKEIYKCSIQVAYPFTIDSVCMDTCMFSDSYLFFLS